MDASHAPPHDHGSTRAERRLAMLDRLAEISMEVVETLRGEIIAAKAAEMEAGEQARAAPLRRRNIPDLTLAFHRATRALRLTHTLQAELETSQASAQASGAEAATEHRVKVVLVDSVAGVQSEPYPMGTQPPAPFEAADARRLQIGRTVRATAAASLLPGEYSPRDTKDYIERLGREADERLEREGEFENLMARPLSEHIDAICRDLGLRPDWPVLADEDWAQFELATGPVGAPLAAYRRPDHERVRPARSPEPWPGRAGPS